MYTCLTCTAQWTFTHTYTHAHIHTYTSRHLPPNNTRSSSPSTLGKPAWKILFSAYLFPSLYVVFRLKSACVISLILNWDEFIRHIIFCVQLFYLWESLMQLFVAKVFFFVTVEYFMLLACHNSFPYSALEWHLSFQFSIKGCLDRKFLWRPHGLSSFSGYIYFSWAGLHLSIFVSWIY